MSELTDSLKPIIDEYIEDEKVLSLTLAVVYWGSVGQNPKTTPPQEGKILETADRFHHYLTR